MVVMAIGFYTSTVLWVSSVVAILLFVDLWSRRRKIVDVTDERQGRLITLARYRDFGFMQTKPKHEQYFYRNSFVHHPSGHAISPGLSLDLRDLLKAWDYRKQLAES